MAQESKDDKKAEVDAVHQEMFETLRDDLGKKRLTIIVLGASGHLARTKTYPSLFELYENNVFPQTTSIVGFARSKLDLDKFRERISEKLKGDHVKSFLNMCTYFRAEDYNDDASYDKFGKFLLEKAENNKNEANRLCYMALPPSVFEQVLPRLNKYVQTTEQQGWTRVILEKPFGKDLKSSNELAAVVADSFHEDQVYRIDHYLAKEMSQNIFVFRFANTIWDTLWDRKSIRCVKISMKEDAGVDGRGGYYDEFGVIRDVFQNHLLQVLTLLAMEQPVSLNANDVRDEKVKVLKAIDKLAERRTIVGQYTKSADGSQPGYLDDDSIKSSNNPNSNQITFVQSILFINNQRWAGVPFICKAGKGLDRRNTEVRVQFKNDGLTLFRNADFNELVIRLQPNEAIWLKVNTKTPGFSSFNSANGYELDLTYKERFGDIKLPAAYTRLILDSLMGDQSLFVRSDELRESWRIVTPFLKRLERRNRKPKLYPRGGRGPSEADEMAELYGFRRSGTYKWHESPSPSASQSHSHGVKI